MLYLFEDYILDADRRELRCGTGLIPVQPQVFDLLEYVIRNRERVVSKDDLIAGVWGGRIVSESALTTRINAARTAIGDSGEEQRLIRTLPRKGVRFVGAVREEQKTATPAAQSEFIVPKTELSLTDRPSIAVLPFLNLSGDPEQEYFADGMVDEIITSLSRIRWLVVASRTSAFAFKGHSADIRDIARKLNVRYVLEGSARRAGGRVRIIGQLIDAATGAHIWAGRVEGKMNDIFELQDRVTESIVGAIEPKLQFVEIERTKRKRTENMDAYDYYLRALPASYRPTPKTLDEALQLLEKAHALDPNYPPANVLAAWLYFYRFAGNWSASSQEDKMNAAGLARAAVDFGTDDPPVLALGAFLLAAAGRDRDMEISTFAANRAIELNPNSALVLQHVAWTLTLTGEQDRALGYFRTAIRLGSSDPLIYRKLTGAAAASILAGRFADAIEFGERARRNFAGWGPTHRFLAAAYAQVGDTKKAAEALAQLQKLEPGVTISHLQSFLPYQNQKQAERLWEGLRKAGMPE